MVLLTAFAYPTEELRSQSRTWPSIIAGISGGISRGILEGEAPIYSGSPDCGTFSSGTLASRQLTLQLISPDLFTGHIGLSIKPGLRELTSTLTQTSDQGTWLFDADAEDATEIEREFRLETVTLSIDLALLGTYRLSDQISLGVGPFIDYTLHQETNQIDQILGPGDLSFSDGQRSRTMIEGIAYSSRPLQFGVEAAGSLTLSMSSHFSLLMEPALRFHLGSPVMEAEWQSLEVAGNLGLLYRFSPSTPSPPRLNLPDPPLPPPGPPVEDTVLAPPFSPPPTLSATINVYSLREGTRRDDIRVRFRETDRCRLVRLAPAVRFDEGKTTLPEQYQQERSHHQPTLDSLISLPPLELQGHLLDVVGLRLQRNPRGQIVLHHDGSRAATERVEQIHSYLSNYWDIETDRIGKSSGPAADPDMIRLSSSSPDILAPVISSRLDRDFDAPMMKIKTSQEAEAGLRSWEITLSNDEKEIARYSSAQPDGRGNTGINWDVLYSDKNLDSSTISAIFMIEDSTGARTIARSETLLLIQKSHIMEEHQVDIEEGKEKYLYWLFPSNALIDSIGYEEIVRDIINHAGEDARVSLSIPDGTGSEPEAVISHHHHLLKGLEPFPSQIISASSMNKQRSGFGQCRGEEAGILFLVEQGLD